MRVPWLGDVLHDAGLPLCPLDGWQGRGVALTSVQGVVAHHTATRSNAADSSVAALLRDGRADLPGPLCQLGLDRRGRYWLIADGKGNHNGYGTWGNQSIGIEAFNDGLGETWPDVQLDAYQRGAAAILRHLDLPASHVKAHRETDPRRKTDPKGIGMDGFRAAVARLLDQGDDDMAELQRVEAKLDELLALAKQTNHPVASDDGNLSKLVRMVRSLAAKVDALAAKHEG